MAKAKRTKIKVQIIKSAGGVSARKIKVSDDSVKGESIDIVDANLLIEKHSLKSEGKPERVDGKTIYTYA